MAITCGEAVVKLLEKYGVDTVFGIPGVHTLELYRGLSKSSIRHVQTRHEQGAAFMADGYARTTGIPGVCFLITGPGVINGLTALGQSWADSIPVLCISSEAASYSLGKGWGMLHEVPDLNAVTAPLTALSATALSPNDVPELIGQAYSIFASQRPRSVHIAIPIDVLAMPVEEEWEPIVPPTRPMPDLEVVERAARVLDSAEKPLIFIGGGAVEATQPLTAIAEMLNASIVTTNAGKGIVPSSHPLNIGGKVCRPAVQQHIAEADCILAIGTELASTDSYIEKYTINGTLIRVDIDSHKINDKYPADIGIVADSTATARMLLEKLRVNGATPTNRATHAIVKQVIAEAMQGLTASEAQHIKLLNKLQEILPANTLIMGDMTQIIYTGSFAMPTEHPRLWHYPAGFCTLGCGLPNGIGAKLAQPERPVIVLVGDGGLMFTVNELITAAELQLALPIVIWQNDGLLQIKEDMLLRDIEPVGVDGVNPDFELLAQAMRCRYVRPDTLEAFAVSVTEAFGADRPTVIVVEQGSDWLID